jgi:hypothetical protein
MSQEKASFLGDPTRRAVAATLLNNYSDFAAGVHGSQTDTAS